MLTFRAAMRPMDLHSLSEALAWMLAIAIGWRAR